MDLAQHDTTTQPETTAEESRRVFVIDDDQSVLDVVALQLRHAGYEVTTFRQPEEFQCQIPHLPSGVVLTDLRMPVADGLAVQSWLQARTDDIKLVILTGYAETPLIVEAMKQGAVGVLDKPFERHVLEDTIHDAFEKLDRSIAANAGLPPGLPLGHTYLDFLSAREREVALLVYRGETNGAIATTLGISVKTIEKHRGRAMKKMKVTNHSDLIRLVGRELRKEQSNTVPVQHDPDLSGSQHLE